MPRDRRLWVKVSTDIGRNPKMSRLSDAAFRAYIEALAHAKELNRDGLIPERDARRWMPEFLELLSNDPDRPSVVAVDGGFQIHDYTVHQESAEAMERRRVASRENGAKGGRPPKPRNLGDNPAGVPSVKAESRVQSPDSSTYVKESSYVGNRAREEPVDKSARNTLDGLGIDPDRLMTHIVKHVHLDVSPSAALCLALDVLDKGDRVKKPQAYVLGAITKNPGETEQFLFESNLV